MVDFLKYVNWQVNETVRRTIKKMGVLYKLNLRDISQYVEISSAKFDARKCEKDFMIDGLDDRKSYVFSAFERLTTLTKVKLKINNLTEVSIDFYHNNDNDLIEKCIRRIYCFINAFGNFGQGNMYNGMHFDILLYYAPRIMSNSYKKSVNEINIIGDKCFFNCACGYASTVNGKMKICVTRKNGCLGLLTHELGHICEMDLGIIRDGKFENPYNRLVGWRNYVKKHFDVSRKCRIGKLNEGVNNGNSSIIHSMFLAIESGGNEIDLVKKYRNFYVSEFIHSFAMLKKLLNWFKYNTIYELVRKDKRKFTQKAQLLEYIFARCIYLLNFDELMIFKVNNGVNIVDDDKYMLLFLNKMIKTMPMIDKILGKIKNDKSHTISMEYYKN